MYSKLSAGWAGWLEYSEEGDKRGRVQRQNGRGKLYRSL